MSPLPDFAGRIPPLDREAMRLARAREDRLTKPPGSLGRLEELAVRIAGMTGQVRPTLARKAVLVLAADHGVADEGVSAYPRDVTGQMVLNFLNGGAAINVLARQAGARVVVVDCGVATDLPPTPGLLARRIRPGTSDLARGPAMSRDEAVRAIQIGVDLVADLRSEGLDLVATGDMGIANTTPSSAIISVLTGRDPAQVTGRGTGVDDAGLRRKIEVIERALAVNRPDPTDPLDVLAKVGGFEIGGLAGVILEAAASRLPVVLDGLISGAAALLASRLCPTARDYLIAGHVSVEVGHRVALEALDLAPLLDLDLRLGEGTGATLAFRLLDAAVGTLNEMATFEEAGVTNRE